VRLQTLIDVIRSAAKEFIFFFGIGGPHFWHRHEGLRVIVGGVPEQESDAASLPGGFDLNFYVVRAGRITF